LMRTFERRGPFRNRGSGTSLDELEMVSFAFARGDFFAENLEDKCNGFPSAF